MDNQTPQPPQTLLRNLSSNKTQGFESEHATRILAYPNGGWAAVAENETSGDDASKQLPAADETEKTARTSRKAAGTPQ